jgi:hypothetical protein
MNVRQIGPLNLGVKPYVRKKSQIVFVDGAIPARSNENAKAHERRD